MPVGEYRGVLGTMWWIVREEGESGGEVTVGGKIVAKSGQRRKGQGNRGSDSEVGELAYGAWSAFGGLMLWAGRLL